MLIRSADLALDRSKDAGGGTFHCYEPQLHVQAEERRVLEWRCARRCRMANAPQLSPVVARTPAS